MLCRRKEDQNCEIFRDVEEAMIDIALDEKNRAGVHGALFAARAKPGSSADHVINFVFRVRLLVVRVAGTRRNSCQARFVTPMSAITSSSWKICRVSPHETRFSCISCSTGTNPAFT